MAGDFNNTSKRRRPTTARSENGAPAKKAATGTSKPASSESTDAKQHSRKIIKAVYRRYNLLSNPDADEGQDDAFEALIDACEGDPAARRLASRLIPRFAHRFPQKLDMAARALMDLSAWDGGSLGPSHHKIAEATRLDALRGLADICDAAAAQSADSRTASSIILHLLRRSQQSKARGKRGVQSRTDASGAVNPAVEQECIRAALAAILLGSPKAMLAACMESLGFGSGELFEAAREEMTAFLKHIPPKKNGLAHAELPAGNLVVWALAGNAKLADWLISQLQSLKGRSQNPEIMVLLDALLDAAPSKQPLAKAAPPASTSDSRRKADSKASESKAASRGAKASKSEGKAGKSDTRAQTEPGTKSDAARLEPRAARAAEHASTRDAAAPAGPEGCADAGPAAGAKPRSAVPEHVLENGGMRRIESGELDEAGPSDMANGRPSSSDRGHSPERHAARGISSERGLLASLPRPGGSCCIAFECLWISGIATKIVGEPQLRRECEEYGAVKRIIFLPPPIRDQALVFFHDIRHAAACYEGVNGEVRLARRPLEVQFCKDAPEIASRPDCPPRLHVWVALFAESELRRDAVMHDLAEAGVPKPASELRVGGAVPGLLLQFSSTSAVAAAVKALNIGRRATSTLGSRGSPRHSRSPLVGGRSPPNHRSPVRRRSPLHSSPPARRSPPRGAPPPDLPDYATSTLWIGQVGPDVDEEVLIAAFKRHGRVTGHKLLRSSNCGFIDFEHVEDAAAAREALHNFTFGSCDIRVEFKEEGRALGRVPNFGGRGGGRFGRGRGRDWFEPRGPRPGFRGGSPPPGYRARGSPAFGHSPPRRRSRSPPHGRAWSPPRSPARSRWDQRGREARSPQLERQQQRCRVASLEPARPDRTAPRRPAAAEPLATPPARSERSASKWDLTAPPAATAAAAPPQPTDSGPAEPASTQDEPQASASQDAVPAPQFSSPPPLPRSPPDASGQPPQPQRTPASVDQRPSCAPVPSHSREGLLQATPSWTGKLAKSGSVVCSIQCLEGPRREAGGANGLEPMGWPSTLDVTLRIDIKYVLQMVSAGVASNLAAVRRLVLTPGAEAESHSRFKEFCAYLTQRGRAGVVQKIPAAGGLSVRTMYLIPPSAAAAADLRVSWRPQEFMLMALIVPA